MTTLVHETWEGGTNGGTVSGANTAFNRLTTRFTFDNAHVPTGQGSLSGKVSVTAQTAQAQADVTASDRGYAEIWMWAATLPPTGLTVASFRNTTSATNLADVRVNADGSIAIRNGGFITIATTAASAFHTSTWMKIQHYYDNAAGQQRLRVFWTTPAGNTPDYDSGLVTTTSAGQINMAQIGFINSTTWTAWFGDYDVNDTAFIVPTGTGSGGTVTWRAGASAQFTDSSHNTAVTIPSTVVTGDIMVLQFVGGQQNTQTTPSGWTALPISQSVTGLSFNAWQRTATSGDPSSTVTVVSDNAASWSRDVHLNVFTGGKVGAASSRLATTSESAHPTPGVVAVDAAAWILNGCGDRGSPSSSSFTLLSGLTQRTSQIQTTGGAAVSSVTATSTSPVVGSGSVGSTTITGTLATTKAVTWTVAVEPTTAVSPLTTSAGPDVFIEPWRTFTITPTASATPDSWSWSQSTASPTGPDITSGATVDSNGTIHLTAPAATQLVQFTLRVTAHKATFADASDSVTVTVYPATRWFVSATGALVPIRYMAVT